MTNKEYADNPEDLNIGIVLQYKIAWNGALDADILVRHARDAGFRGVSASCEDDLQEKMLKQACEKYGIKFCQRRPAIQLAGPDVLAKLIVARDQLRNVYFEVDLNKDGSIAEDEINTLDILRKWIDRFGHAYYEARPIKEITTKSNAHIFKNVIAPYQIYVFIHQPLEDKITLTGVPEIKRAAWIDTRKELDFKQDGDSITINLVRDPDDADFTIYGLRLEAHRPEDDLGPTKF